MIYRSGIFGLAQREAYRSGRTAVRRKTAFGLFMGLLAFAFFFMAQTMTESIFAETLPQLMQASFFSTITIYVHLASFLYTLYLLVYYEGLTFAEIRDNRWYLLLKMGYSRASLITARLSALLLSAVTIYSLGFAFTLFLTFFLKYSLVTAYLPSLYLAGLIDLLVLASLALFFSSIVKTASTGRALLLLSLPALHLLKSQTGFSAILSNRLAMQDFYRVFSPQQSLYPLATVALTGVCLLIASATAWLISRRYRPSGVGFTADYTVVRVNRRTGRKKLIRGGVKKIQGKKLLDTTLSLLLVFFILAALLFNIAVLVINATAKGRHVSFRGVIPYVFKSSTMEPDIKLNDLAFFRSYDGQEDAQVGQIILFDQDKVMYVERVIGEEGQVYIVDIDNYPSTPEHASMVKMVEPEQIVGIYSGRSRWLGALILFANTIFGRILFLLIPALLLFFQRSLAGWKPGVKRTASSQENRHPA